MGFVHEMPANAQETVCPSCRGTLQERNEQPICCSTTCVRSPFWLGMAVESVEIVDLFTGEEVARSLAQAAKRPRASDRVGSTISVRTNLGTPHSMGLNDMRRRANNVRHKFGKMPDFSDETIQLMRRVVR